VLGEATDFFDDVPVELAGYGVASGGVDHEPGDWEAGGGVTTASPSDEWVVLARNDQARGTKFTEGFAHAGREHGARSPPTLVRLSSPREHDAAVGHRRVDIATVTDQRHGRTPAPDNGI
jgi:hypothetical protein